MDKMYEANMSAALDGMTEENMSAQLSKYKDYFLKHNIPSCTCPSNQLCYSDDETLAHAHAIVDKIRRLSITKKKKQAFYWFGFLQSCFYNMRIYTMEDLANHNKS